MFRRPSQAVMLLWGWRRAAVVALAGAFGALSLAPVHAFPALWVSFAVLVWALDGAVDLHDGRRLSRLGPAFVVGWAFGFGWFLAGLWWIGAAFTVDLRQFGWMIPFALAALSIGLGLFHGLATAFARLVWSEGPSRIAALAVAFLLADRLRGWVLTGFPWNLIGHGWAANDPMMQTAALTGGYGLTFVAVLVFAAPAVLARGAAADRRFVAAVAVVAAGLVGWGVLRLATTPTTFVPDVHLRLVQPAVDQWAKWRPEFRTETVERYVELSSRPAKDASGAPLPEGLRTFGGRGIPGVTHLIWPESAFPFILTREPWALATIAQLIGEHTTLLTGAVRAEVPAAGDGKPRFYNSIYAIGAGGEILAAYDKTHLVPFGEYLPFQETLESIGLRQLTEMRGGYSAGPSRRTLRLPGLPPFAPLICYEIVFPDEVVDRTDRPQWILNVTNDGWFGVTSGPWQHFHQARLRAVEEGLPVVRAANTGISAVVDPLGRIVAASRLGEVAVVDADLPEAIAAPPSARFGEVSVWILAVLAFGWSVYGRIHSVR